ncbi:MAG TPA: radical SAM protein [Planctomycetota bacterium]|nr:radical SAM protein [Planctomycetota bacterium]
MRVLLLNPPGRRTYIRDYFCSKTTKSNYLFHPIDLVVLSGTLAAHHEVSVLDCMAESLVASAAMERILAFDPEVVVSLVGSVSWEEDRAFLRDVAASGARVIAIGDVLQEDSEARLAEEPWLEAALHVFANQDVVHYLENDRAALEEMTVREPGGAIRRIRVHGKQRGGYRVPRPRHELFPERGYRFSFARSARFATLLTDYGCPYPCTFCVIGTLGFQTRPVADVLEEIDHLRARGVRELFFMDQTFGVVRPRALELCAALAERGDLSWTAFTRPDTADDELLAAMKRAGCHTLILGVESADDALLAQYKKGYVANEVRAGFARLQTHGIRSVGTFIIGLPEETEESLERTLALAFELELDFMSLNMAVPRFGTPFRARMLELGLADAAELVMDQGGTSAFLPTHTLDRRAMEALKRRMVRRFYLRPSYLWRRLTSARNLHEISSQAREGIALFARNLS